MKTISILLARLAGAAPSVPARLQAACAPTAGSRSSRRGDEADHRVPQASEIRLRTSAATPAGSFLNGLLRLLPLLLWLSHFALLPQAAAQNTIRFTHIAAGSSHSLALRADGTVVAWGYNGSGQTAVPVGLTGVVAVAAGAEHSLALKANGTVVAWGYNYGGARTVPDGLTGVVALAAGEVHSLALKADGTVVAWGRIWNGSADYVAATVPAGLTGVVALAAGFAHGLALKGDGTVLAWGFNEEGQSTVPGGLTGVVALAAGGRHSLALKSDGTVVAWGQVLNEDGSAFVTATVPAGLTGVVALAAGYYHSLALKADGTVVAWGNNYYGQSTVPGRLTGVVALAAGSVHSLALKADGTIVGWGWNEYGQVPQPFITTQPISQVAAMGLPVDLSVSASGIPPLSYQWRKDGTDISGATGPVYAIPTVQTHDAGNYSVVINNVVGSVTSSNAVLTVAPIAITRQPQNQTALWAGTTARFSVTVSGSAPLRYQWRKDGAAIGGATGPVYSFPITQSNDAGSYSVVITNVHGSVTSSNAVVMVVPNPLATRKPGTVVSWGGTLIEPAPGELTGVVALAKGEARNSPTLALKSDGTVVAWGPGGNTVPDGLAGVVAIAAGSSEGAEAGSFFDHNLALKADGTVVAWGNYDYGQSTIPTGLNGVIGIAARAADNIIALKADGTVVAWGRNDLGQITVPAGLTGIVALAAGYGHNLALKADGTVVAWGYNDFGQSTVPAGLTGVVALAAGIWHSLALKSDGTVVAWGDNGNGQSTVPIGLTGVVALAGGTWHSLALKSDGTVVAWGNNDYGQSTIPTGLSGVIGIAAGGVTSMALVADSPALVVKASGDQVLLSWPLWAQGFALQATPNLADANSWTPVLTMPVVEGSRNRVTEPVTGAARFYRLKK